MAIDFAKMKQKFQALQGNGSDRQNAFWKPQDGDQTIRIVPTADGDPFKEFHFHYNVGKNPGFLCNKKQHGKDCPVCNFACTFITRLKRTTIQKLLSLPSRCFPSNDSSHQLLYEVKKTKEFDFGAMERWLIQS